MIFFTCIGCKKEKQQEENNTDLLTRAPWVVTKEEYHNGDGRWKEFTEKLYGQLSFNFKANGTIRIENKTSGVTWDGEWNFTDNSTKIWTNDKLLPEWKIVRFVRQKINLTFCRFAKAGIFSTERY